MRNCIGGFIMTIEKKYRNLIFIVAIFLLCIRYWDGLIQILGTGVKAAFPLVIGSVVAYVLNIF
jgi:hypothetical protein